MTASASEVGQPAVPPPLTPSLELAAKWAKDLGNQVIHISASLPGGKIDPALSITHGTFVLFCKDLGESISLIGIVDIPPDSRARLRALSSDESSRMFMAFRLALMENPRSGFSFFPTDFKTIHEVQKFSLEQRFRVSESDTASFNRFADAIQELATGILRAAMVFGPMGVGQTVVRQDTGMYR